MELLQGKFFTFEKGVINPEVSFKTIKNPFIECSYDKFYSLYAFDEVGYHKKIKKLILNKNLKGVYCIPFDERKKIREEFYVLDEYGEKQSFNDEKHIFRYCSLWKILTEIYALFPMKYSLNEDVTNIDGLLFYQEEFQCEIDGFQMKSLKTRVLAHLELLRLLKKGYDIKESVQRVRKEFLNGN